jgi:microsomal epoxide hydrolase
MKKSLKQVMAFIFSISKGGQKGRTLFFVPGWLMPAEIFQRQLEFFVSDYHVVAFSPRSQGKSDIYLGEQLALKRASDIKELLQYLEIQQFVLIGWSLGVMESLDYVQRYGTEGLKGLVLIDNSIGEGVPPKSTISMQLNQSTEKFTQFAKGFSRSMFRLEPPPTILQSVESSTLKLANNPQNAYKILQKPYPREYYKNTIYASNLPIWYAITPRYQNQAILLKEKYPLGEYTVYAKDAGHAPLCGSIGTI